MRTEQEMLHLILQVAKGDERIRAVVMNGSRTNPRAPKDLFQDYDIVYLVTELDSFLATPDWIDVFGERIIMQLPNHNSLMPSDTTTRFPYLMQFADGNRIDLTLLLLSEKDAYIYEDKLIKILLDKDGSLPELPAPTDEGYWVRRPSQKNFADCCNEFWWVSTYVAKGLWRRELPYAQDHLNGPVRAMLMTMLSWQVGIATHFSVSIGKSGKYAERYLSDKSWQELLATYADGTYESVWQALFVMGQLFRSTASDVAQALQFSYNQEEDERVTAYLQHIKQLSPDATEID